MFYDNLVYLCNVKNTTPTTVARICGISANAVSNWKKKKVIPNGEIVIKLAEYLNVSTDYLLLGKEPSIPTEYKKLFLCNSSEMPILRGSFCSFS